MATPSQRAADRPHPYAPPEDPPAELQKKRKRVAGLKRIPDSWRTMPSQPWPGPKKAEQLVRYHIDQETGRTYWRFNGLQRYPVCACMEEGLCGLEAHMHSSRRGYSIGCATREARKERYDGAKVGGVLPEWSGYKEHVGFEHFVMHKGRECVTMKSCGLTRPLCACGVCLKPCSNFKQEYAPGCLQNNGAKCVLCNFSIATTNGHCPRCATAVGAKEERMAAREPELLALMAQHGMKRAPHDPNDADAQTAYAQQSFKDDYKPRIVVKIGSGQTARWATGCVHNIPLDSCTVCNTLEQLQKSKKNCSICTRWLVGNTYKLGTGLCVECGKKEGVHQRTEVRLRAGIDARVPFESSCLDDTYFGTDTKHCDVNKRRRPDKGWFYTDRAILLETDEGGGHCRQCYSAQCDATWMTDMATSIEGAMTKAGLDGKQVRVFVIRFNPHERDEHLPVVREKQRLDAVCALVNKLRTLTSDELAAYDPLVPHVWYYYYHSKCADKIAHARTSGGIVVHDVIE